MDYYEEKQTISLDRLNVVQPNTFFELNDVLKDKNINKKLYNDLHKEVDKDLDLMVNLQNKLTDIIKKEYKIKTEREMKEKNEDFFGEVKSEGRVLDYYWKLKDEIENCKINPIGVCQTALLYKKKAEEMNCIEDLKKMKYFGLTFNTGYYLESYLGAILNGERLYELASNYEEYSEYHKKTDYILDSITKWMKDNSEIQKWLKDEELTSFVKMNSDQWTYCIALYYAVNNRKIQDFTIFYPIDGEADGHIKSFGYHIIYSTDLNILIEKISKTLNNKKISDKSLNKILKEALKDNLTNNLEYTQYMFILSNYFKDHPRSLKKDVIFHPPTDENNSNSFSLNYFDIDYDKIKNYIAHLKNVESKHKFELVDTIKKWAVSKKYIQDVPLSEKAWIKIIKRYHKKNNIEISEDIILYVPRKHLKDYLLPYRILYHDDLTDENSEFSFFDCLYDSESDTNVNSDSDSDIF